MRKWFLVGFWLAFSPAALAQFVVGGRLCAPDAGCKVDSTVFADTLKTSTAWQWSFGDGGSSIKKNPKYFFKQAGEYTVTLTRTVNGIQETLTKKVVIGALPPIFKPWKTDTTICPGTKLTINPYPNNAPAGAKYLWYPTGDTTQTITTDSSGCYSVQATLPNGCSYENKIKVKVCLEQSNQEGAKWFFGNGAGLDFSGGSPRAITDGQLNTPEGSSSISNYKGKLLFYTDGVSVYGKDHKPMFSKDTVKLNGSPNSTQSALIVPQPPCRGCEYLYYIFTTTEINGKKQFSYSVVDMRQNMGKGEIIQKNVPIQTPPTTERIASVLNEADSTYWIVSHDYGNNTFRVYHATNAGLQESSVFSAGAVQNTPNEAEGYMKFSPKDSTGNRKIAVVVPGPPRNLVQLFNFNEKTGTISGPPLTLDLGPAPPKAYGVEFSPDATKMYVSMQGNGTTAAPSRVWQYDISLKDSARITDSKILIDSSATQVYGALQIGSDNKIYLAIKDSGYLGVINNPNQDSQQEVKFVVDGLFLGGKKSQLGLPNFVQNFTQQSDGPGFMYSDTCSGAPTNFQASPLCDPLKDTYTWNFGDGSAPVSSKQQMQAHTYTKAGTYKVSLRLVNRCKDSTITQNVTIIPTPDAIRLRSPIDTCVNTLVLDAGVKADRYLWIRNGFVIGRTQKVSVTNAQSGNYTVIAANGEVGQCPTKAQSTITIRKPPAFSLGADTSLCVGTTTDVVLDARRTPTRWDTFKWNTGETTQTISVKQPGTYTAEVKNNATQCINNDTIVVKSLPKARLTASLRPPTACLASDGNITITGVLPTANYTYLWFSGTTQLPNKTNILDNVKQGQYRVSLNATNAVCATDSTFNLQANNNLRITSAIVNARCTQPTSGSITISATGGIPATYAWTNASKAAVGTSAPLLDKLSPGKYNVKVTDQNGCEATLDDITVGINPEKFINLGPDRKKCIGDTVFLTALRPDLGNNVYSWSTSQITNQISISTSGTYKVSVVNTLTGCKDEDEIIVNFVPRPVYDLTKEASICEQDGSKALLLVKGAANLSYLWLRGDQREPRLVVNRAGVYPIRISNPEGCVVTDSSVVVLRCEPTIYVPDIFTPNGDGNNDLLELHGDHFTDLEFRIFNRWGELIYFSTDLSQKWDGTYRGMAYPPMTYPWVLSFRPSYAPTAFPVVKRGSVLLIR